MRLPSSLGNALLDRNSFTARLLGPCAYGGFTLFAILFQGISHLWVSPFSTRPLFPDASSDYISDEHTLLTSNASKTFKLASAPFRPIRQLGLVFPFHSPLLRKSLLFSFPPLIKMLQFRGFILFNLRFHCKELGLELLNYLFCVNISYLKTYNLHQFYI